MIGKPIISHTAVKIMCTNGSISNEGQLSAFLSGHDTTNAQSKKNAEHSVVVHIANECAVTGGLIVPPAHTHKAFQIIGHSWAALHCSGLDDIPLNERCRIRKADRPRIFATANGEVPCDEVISTEIIQPGITRDMYVMKD